MDDKKVEILEKIYYQQHYFVDRHDSMAERFMNILLVEVSCFAFIFTMCMKDKTTTVRWLSITQALLILLFLACFVTSLIKLFLIIRPLSTKAKDSEENLIKIENKPWILNSSVYYQGILAQIQNAKKNEKVPSEEYLAQLDNNNLGRDYLQQIFILSQYSQYKKERLEAVLKWIIGTSVFGVLATISFILDVFFVI